MARFQVTMDLEIDGVPDDGDMDPCDWVKSFVEMQVNSGEWLPIVKSIEVKEGKS